MNVGVSDLSKKVIQEKLYFLKKSEKFSRNFKIFYVYFFKKTLQIVLRERVEE